jgi:hypothetical protein
MVATVKIDGLAQILYEDACNEVRWPLDLEPWDTLSFDKRETYRRRALRIAERVHNLFRPPVFD